MKYVADLLKALFVVLKLAKAPVPKPGPDVPKLD